MADLGLAADEMNNRIEDYKGWTTPTAGQIIWATKRLNDGYRRFLRGSYLDDRGVTQNHQWSFLRPWATLAITHSASCTSASGVYDATTGNTVITETGSDSADFYPNLVGKNLVVADTGTYQCNGWTSVYVVTISGDHAFATKGITYQHSGIYDLPAGFAGLVEPFTYVPVAGERMPTLKEVTPEEVQAWHNTHTTGDDPEMFCIIPMTFTAATGQRWQAQFAAPPDTARVVKYRYRLYPAPLTDSATEFTVGGADYCDVILQGAYAEAERQSHEGRGQQDQNFHIMMREAVRLDQATLEPVEVVTSLGGSLALAEDQ